MVCRAVCAVASPAQKDRKNVQAKAKNVSARTRDAFGFHLILDPTRWDTAGWTMAPNDAYFDACRAIFSYHLSLA